MAANCSGPDNFPAPAPLALQCPCRKAYIPLQLFEDSLPFKSNFCGCNICRASIGFQLSLLAPLHASALQLESPIAKTSSLWAFDSKSPHGTKHFCDECGAGLYYQKDQQIELFLPSLAVPDLSNHVTLPPLKPALEKLPRWAFPPASKSEEARISPPGEIEGSCACGGVTVKLRRAPADYKSDSEFREWVVEDEHGTPAFASNYCFCNECRWYASAPMFSWMFVPTKLFDLISGERSDGKKALQGYKSSERVIRRFCSGCGCQVSFAIRPEMWDVSPGVFDPEHLVKGRWVKYWYDGDNVKRTHLEKYVTGWVENEPSFPSDGIQWLGELVRAYEGVVEEKRPSEGW